MNIKLIIILLLMSSYANAQDIEQDAIDHFGAGIVAGGFTQAILYQQTGNKFWSFVGGNIAGISAGIIKENLDVKFSNRDLKNTILGTLTGTITIRLVIGKSKLRSNCTEAQLLEADMYSD